MTYCMGAYIKYFTLAYSFQIHSLYTKLGGGPGTKAPDTPADRGWERQIEKGWRGAVVWRGLPPSVKSPQRMGAEACHRAEVEMVEELCHTSYLVITPIKCIKASSGYLRHHRYLVITPIRASC